MGGKSKEDLAKMHWRDRYAYESAAEEARLSRLSESELIAMVNIDEVGHYYAIWRVLAKKGTVAIAALPMWHYLMRMPGEENMLSRYHCAAALFEILDIPDPESKNDLRKQVQWDSQGEDARQEALLELRTTIEDLQKRSRELL